MYLAKYLPLHRKIFREIKEEWVLILDRNAKRPIDGILDYCYLDSMVQTIYLESFSQNSSNALLVEWMFEPF